MNRAIAGAGRGANEPPGPVRPGTHPRRPPVVGGTSMTASWQFAAPRAPSPSPLLLPLLLLLLHAASSVWSANPFGEAVPPVTATVMSRQTLWRPSRSEKLLRIPALAALNATHVLAFAEVHVNPGNHIVGKLSTTGGVTWGAEQVIAAEHGAKIGNPAPVVLGDGTVLLVYCRDNLRVLTRNITISGGKLVMTPPTDITLDATAGLPDFSFVASGPPGGVRSSETGRIVVAMDFVPKKLNAEIEEPREGSGSRQSTTCRSYAIASNNNGRTWQHSPPIGISGKFSTSENQVASIDGDLATIITTARVGNTTPVASNYRAVAVSTDSGQSFSAFKETNLPDPTCEGSTLGHDGNFYLSSGLASTMGNRSNVSLSVCESACIAGGYVDWRPLLSIDPGLSSYSSLAAVSNDTLLLLYEVGGGETITELSLVTIALGKAEQGNAG